VNKGQNVVNNITTLTLTQNI